MIDLCHLDEAGFAPTLPTNYSWSARGQRLTVPYEAPQGRRVNALGAYFSHGAEVGRFEFATYARLPQSRAKTPRRSLAEQAASHRLNAAAVGTIDAECFLAFVWRVAGRPVVYPADWQRERPLVIALDNYSVHTSERVQQERAALERAGVTFFYLPSYSPELSAIEPIWQATKHHEMSQRSYDQLGALKRAVEEALARKATTLLAAHGTTTYSHRAAA